MEVVKDMPDDKLKQFIPKMGDRMALIRFCKSTFASRNGVSLIERIKLSQSKSCGVDLQLCQSSTKKKQVAVPNLKATRTVNIGWILNGKPVREKNGGGRRSCSLSKEAKKKDILEKAIEFYFPNGVSVSGLKLEDTDYDLLDFKEHVLEDDDTITVGQMYAITGLNLLRFYLSTNIKEDIDWSPGNAMKKLKKNPKKKSPKRRKYPERNMPKNKNDLNQNELEYGFDKKNNDFEDTEKLSMTKGLEIESEKNPDEETNQDFVITQTNVGENRELERFYDLENDLDELEEFLIIHRGKNKDDFVREENPSNNINTEDVYVLPNFEDLCGLDGEDFQQPSVPESVSLTSVGSSSTVSSITTVVVHRGQIFKELTTYFIDIKNVDNLRIEVEIIGTNGIKELALDGGGVLKDALSEYWSFFYESLCEGATLKVPEINYMYTEEKWKAIAKILLIGFRQTQYFPIRLPKPFMEYAFIGKEVSDIKEALLSFVSEVDADIIKMALTDFDKTDTEELSEVLSNLECKHIIKKENIQSVIKHLAHTYILQKPMFILDCFRIVLKNKMTFEDIKKVYEECEVTNRRVLGLLVCYDADMHKEKEMVFAYLKKFVRECNKDYLERFLRFCTGADLITCSHITIEFSILTGIERRPIGHTCNNILELPLSYAKENFRVFKSELNNVLKSNVWCMDIV
ncbi:unnamed protein product [Ceutorhynchus assimilis]|uniref:HECT domain-containing protein n=1 Tax=Ceutorhynchus assimilis TaxID=467358 RepID=A0A9N9QLF3_9CUCU|nr:unnamed protein product [Ceutorhynchus assimilis]